VRGLGLVTPRVDNDAFALEGDLKTRRPRDLAGVRARAKGARGPLAVDGAVSRIAAIEEIT